MKNIISDNHFKIAQFIVWLWSNMRENSKLKFLTVEIKGHTVNCQFCKGQRKTNFILFKSCHVDTILWSGWTPVYSRCQVVDSLIKSIYHHFCVSCLNKISLLGFCLVELSAIQTNYTQNYKAINEYNNNRGLAYYYYIRLLNGASTNHTAPILNH